MVHLKDFVCDEDSSGPVYDLIDEEGKVGDRETLLSDNGFDYRPLGQGIQDFPSIIEASKQAGVTIFNCRTRRVKYMLSARSSKDK